MPEDTQLTITLPKSKVKNLQAYLERLAVDVKTTIIHKDVLDMMKIIETQTGVGLNKDELPDDKPKPPSACAHLFSKNHCVLCGEPK